jgi:uncharacterized repeat protein (TIGR03943 family)
VVVVSAAGGTITVLVGTVLLRLTVTGDYQRYVRVELGPWLALAGAVVVVLGATTVVRALRSSQSAAAQDHDGQDDHRDVWVGWLLLAPIAALLLVAPPALGSYGVDRGAAVDVRPGASSLEPLQSGGEPVPMTLLEFNQRAFDHDGDSFNGATVQLTGFVADEPGGDARFRLARYQIACCAADAAPVVARIVGAHGTSPPRDRWVTVTGTFHSGGAEVPELSAISIVEIPEPDDPYE